MRGYRFVIGHLRSISEALDSIFSPEEARKKMGEKWGGNEEGRKE